MLCSFSLEILNNFIRAMEHTPGTYSLGLLTVLAPPTTTFRLHQQLLLGA